jgi:hypothetical protein
MKKLESLKKFISLSKSEYSQIKGGKLLSETWGTCTSATAVGNCGSADIHYEMTSDDGKTTITMNSGCM